MFRKTYLITAIAFASINTTALAGTHSLDARSIGMGGVGVTSADYLTAAFHNPALVAKYNSTDDFGVLLPYVGAQIQNQDQIVDGLEDFSDIYDSLNPSSSQSDAQALIDSLTLLQGDIGSIQVGVGGAISLPSDTLSLSIFGKGYVDAFVLADVSSSDLLASSYTNPNYTLESQGLTLGVSVVEFGVSLAKSFDVRGGTLYLGLTPKYQTVNTINYSVDINNYEFEDWDDDRYQSEYSNFNVDFGIVYEMSKGYSFGFVGKNLMKEKYDTVVSDSGIQGTYTINPVYTASTTYKYSFFTISADIDLNESERYETLTGLNIGDLDSDNDNVQMAGVGVELDAWKWAQIRFGYQSDLVGTIDDQYTVGLGFSPFDVFHLEIAGSYSGEEQFGAALQTSFTF